MSRYTATLSTKGSGVVYAVLDHEYPNPEAKGQPAAVWIHAAIEGPDPAIPEEYSGAILLAWFQEQQARIRAESARDELQARLDDLHLEVARAIKGRNAAEDKLDTVLACLEAVLQLHRQQGCYCETCWEEEWPCRTARAAGVTG